MRSESKVMDEVFGPLFMVVKILELSVELTTAVFRIAGIAMVCATVMAVVSLIWVFCS